MNFWYPRFFSGRPLALVFLSMAGMAITNLLWLVPAISQAHRSTSLLALEEAGRLGSNIEISLNYSLRNAEDAAGAIAAEPSLSDRNIKRLLALDPELDDVGVTDSSGREVAHIGRAGALPLLDHSHDSYFYLALQGAPSFSNIVSTGEAATIVLAVPVGEKGSVTGAIIANLDISKLAAWGGVADLNATAYVVDRNGYVVVSSDSARVPPNANIESRQIVQKVIVDGRQADGLAPGDSYVERGERMFAVGLPIPVAGWGVFVEEPQSRAFAADALPIALALLVWLLGAGIVLIVIMSNWRLGRLNAQLDGLLKENYEVGKILVRRDRELTEANARLMALDESKSEFVSIAAHQLRTPVTGIRWAFSMLLDQELGPLAPSQQRILGEGLKSAIRMADLINVLLNVARIEEGRFGLRLSRQPLPALIEESVSRHLDVASQKGVALQAALAPDLPLLDLDKEKMDIALDNLLDNAIKYTPPGGQVTITAVPASGVARVAVADTGIGIPRRQLGKLFEKFFRADNAQHFQTAGTGLGLYVAKNIIEAHGGFIRVESEENKGTTVFCELPIPKD